MNTRNRFFLGCAVVVIFLSHARNSIGGEVTVFNWYSGVASLAATSILPPVAPNNDDAAGLSPNEIYITQKNYFAVGPVDLTFDVIDSGGVTEYAFKEGVFNNTGLNWSAYHIELGVGTGAGFVKSTAGDGLDFDAPDYNSGYQFNPAPGFFPSVAVTEDDIYADGGVMPYLSFAGYFRFSVDVPDGITQFTVRQSPVAVPEPSTWVLALLSAASVAMFRCRRASVSRLRENNA